MRKIIALAALAAAFISTPAAAQSAGDLLSLLSRGSGTATRLQYDNCRWLKGVARSLCQAERLARVATDVDQAATQYRRAQRNRITGTDFNERRPDVTAQLASRCSDGDSTSCTSLTKWRKASAAYEAARLQDGRGPSLNIGSADRSGQSPVPAAIRDLCMRGDQVACQTAYDLGRNRRD